MHASHVNSFLEHMEMDTNGPHLYPFPFVHYGKNGTNGNKWRFQYFEPLSVFIVILTT